MRSSRAQTHARHRWRSEAGQIVVWSAFLLPILLVAAGLTFDVGNMINIRDELATSVDAATLAAARGLYDSKASETYARTTAKNVAAENQVPSLGKNSKGTAVNLDLNASNAATGNIVLGKWDFTTRKFTAAATPLVISDVNAVRINAPLGQVAGTLPLAFGRIFGMPTYDTTRTSTAVMASPSVKQPNCPLVVNRDVFTGKAKGFFPPNDIILSTKVNDIRWTGFYGATNASDIGYYAENPTMIPTIKVGDVLNVTTANQGSNYHAVKLAFPPGSVMIIPVVKLDSLQSGSTTATVVGFSTIKVDAIEDSGNPKYIDGTVIVANDTGSPNTEAECFGFNCRAFLVN